MPTMGIRLAGEGTEDEIRGSSSDQERRTALLAAAAQHPNPQICKNRTSGSQETLSCAFQRQRPIPIPIPRIKFVPCSLLSLSLSPNLLYHTHFMRTWHRNQICRTHT
jgi:hypothetical protein